MEHLSGRRCTIQLLPFALHPLLRSLLAGPRRLVSLMGTFAAIKEDLKLGRTSHWANEFSVRVVGNRDHGGD
jgi:hypothetical protein